MVFYVLTKILIMSKSYFDYLLVSILWCWGVCAIVIIRSTRQFFPLQFFLGQWVPQKQNLHHISDCLSLVHQEIFVFVLDNNEVQSYMRDVQAGGFYLVKKPAMIVLTLHKICENTGFHWSVFSCLRTESTISYFI